MRFTQEQHQAVTRQRDRLTITLVSLIDKCEQMLWPIEFLLNGETQMNDYTKQSVRLAVERVKGQADSLMVKLAE